MEGSRSGSRIAAPPSSTTETSVESEILRLFDAGPDGGLRITVRGTNGEGNNEDAFRELLASLQMYDTNYAQPEEVLVQPPDERTIARALSILAKPEHQKRILNDVLKTFGRRLIDPLGVMLHSSEDGSLASRLSMIRDLFLSQINDLRLTNETSQILVDDLRAWLTDDYLTMLAEHEERVQRPRLTQLSKRVLNLVASVFHQAMRSWPSNAEQIANSVTRRMKGKVSLKESPVVIRNHIVAGIEEFLWVETSTELEGALSQLFSENTEIIKKSAVTIDRVAYQEFAERCWEIIAEYA
jgi:hypothetical protein